MDPHPLPFMGFEEDNQATPAIDIKLYLVTLRHLHMYGEC